MGWPLTNRLWVPLVALVLIMGQVSCASKLPDKQSVFEQYIWSDLMEESYAAASFLRKAEKLEMDSPDQATTEFKKALTASRVDHAYEYYRSMLEQTIKEIQENPDIANKFRDEANLGFAHNYNNRVGMHISSRVGLARIYAKVGSYEEARSELNSGLEEIRELLMPLNPPEGAASMLKCYLLLADIERHVGRTGRALIARTSGELVEGYVKSDAATHDTEVYLKVQKAQQKVPDFLGEVHMYQFKKAQAKYDTQLAVLQVVALAMVQTGSMLSQFGATQAMAESGGVMTPLVQTAQMNAQLVQFQAQMVTAMVKRDAAQIRGLEMAATPWAIPMFSRQLVDPAAGANSRGIVRNFVNEATRLGHAPTLAHVAQQVIRDVDALPTVQTTSDSHLIVKSVESFAGVFNAFLAQVQEIKAAK